MGGEIARVELTDAERTTLTICANAGKTEQRIAKRFRVVLLSSEGHPLSVISERVGLSVNSCLKWRKRFIEKRLDGLDGDPRQDTFRRGRIRL